KQGHPAPLRRRWTWFFSRISISYSLPALSRLVFDCSPPDDVSFRKPRLHNRFEIISRSRLHGALLKPSPGLQPNKGMITFEANTLPGDNKNAFLRAEIKIERRGK